MSAEWISEFSTTDSHGRRVEYWTRALAHHSHAERPDKVTVSGRAVHRGWVSDHQGYKIYQERASQ